MGYFGKPPDRTKPALSYPGVSGSRFNPLEANKVWLECIKKEKEGRYVHGLLDAHNKLGLDKEWGTDVSRKDGLMPSYESLDEVYRRLHWGKTAMGRGIPPDPQKVIYGRRKSRGKRKSKSKQSRKLGTAASEVALLTCGEPVVPVTNSHIEPPQQPSAAKGKGHPRKTRADKFKEKVAAGVISFLEQEIAGLGHSNSSVEALAQRAAEPQPMYKGARYIPLVQTRLSKAASAPTLCTAQRAAGRAAVRRK